MRIAIFASGGGSNFQAILDACQSGEIPAQVVLCIASRPDAGVVERARKHDIPVQILPKDPVEAERTMLDALHQYRADLVALAGFMRLIPRSVVQSFQNRILNIHPALLPDFGGKGMYGSRVHESVLSSGAKVSGATVHLVDEEYDTGPIVLQESVPVLPDDTPQTLAARVLEVEHRIYPRAIGLFAKGLVQVEGPGGGEKGAEKKSVHIISET